MWTGFFVWIEQFNGISMFDGSNKKTLLRGEFNL
jgi:hypothetical protein